MTIAQQIITIGAVTLGTLCTRFLPFIIFPAGKETPNYIKYLGKVLPCAVTGLLAIYCYKSVSVTSNPFGLPEFIAGGLTAGGFTSGRKICFSPSRREPYAICCS